MFVELSSKSKKKILLGKKGKTGPVFREPEVTSL